MASPESVTEALAAAHRRIRELEAKLAATERRAIAADAQAAELERKAAVQAEGYRRVREALTAAEDRAGHLDSQRVRLQAELRLARQHREPEAEPFERQGERNG